MSFSISNPGIFTITMRTNNTFLLNITWYDATGSVIDLSSYTGKMSIKDNAETLLLTMTTSNGEITLSSSSPNIILSLSVTNIASLLPATEPLAYDLVLEDGFGNDYCILAGPLVVSQGVTTP